MSAEWVPPTYDADESSIEDRAYVPREVWEDGSWDWSWDWHDEQWARREREEDRR